VAVGFAGCGWDQGCCVFAVNVEARLCDGAGCIETGRYRDAIPMLLRSDGAMDGVYIWPPPGPLGNPEAGRFHTAPGGLTMLIVLSPWAGSGGGPYAIGCCG